MESLVSRREELAKRQKLLRDKKIKFEKYLKVITISIYINKLCYIYWIKKK